MTNNLVSRNDLMLYLAESSTMDYKAVRFHLALARLFVDVDQKITLKESDGAELMNIDARQFRRLKRIALEDGYWLNTPGRRSSPSSYLLSPKLISAVVAHKNKKDS